MEKGKLIIFSAPSGAGKTTIVKHLLNKNDTLAFSISATTRDARHYEKHGVHYYFISTAEFEQKIKQDAFVEHEQVYEGLYYGTLHEEMNRLWAMGKHIIFDIDVQGGINLKKMYGKRALSIFVQPPSAEILAERLRNRKTESEESLNARIQKSTKELDFAPSFDTILVNDALEDAFSDAQKLVDDFVK